MRSSAARSMPGMMDTVLDLGIDDVVEQALATLGTAAFARDTRQRFSRLYQRIAAMGESGSTRSLVPADPYTQLRTAIEAVFASWNSPRAIAYRAHHGIDDNGGTAVVVQSMVFGNMGFNSGAGVVFSRNPITGADERFGEWVPGGQGDDVVSGTVDVEPIAALGHEQPSVYDELLGASRTLERLAADVQEIEFTVEEGKLWLLQTRAAERSAQAAVRLALQLRREGLIDDAEVLHRVSPAQVETLLLPSLQPEIRLAAPLLARGLPASPEWHQAVPTRISMRPWTPPTQVRTSFWCATTPAPMTSTACWPRAASSPKSAAPPATPRWSAANSARWPWWAVAAESPNRWPGNW
ncbi:pyruvate phosphate dikinase, PEP/pyruvate binding domain protein [Mycobacterium xenopi 4042]|uniref:Pyruvate phosphate dikinase, PEP/pyruvate binding domain protein n=1 Tax=Mycobacterium xenopi 4042 TaxID=1299334 RepID=X8DWX6_MYCXE|nr:pyruvate phosphate dikinase, PEP/pyruvate binding domain protein [Mycobacterium xenopi 4042]